MSNEFEGGVRVRTHLRLPGNQYPIPSEVEVIDRDFSLKCRLPEGLNAAYLQVLAHEVMEVSFMVRGANPALVFFSSGENSINLSKAIEISEEISKLKVVQKDLKDAFYHRALDGGPKAALEHPLYIRAQMRIDELQEELTLLV